MVKKRASMMMAVLETSSLVALFAASPTGSDPDPWTCMKPEPTTTWSDACMTACPTPALYNRCQETLLHAPDAAAANAYALAAAERVKASFHATAERARRLLGGGWFPGPQREACRRCADEDYVEASAAMAGLAAGLVAGCVVERLSRADYARATAAVERCGAALREFFPASPLVGMNAADRELAVPASALGGPDPW